MLWLRRPSVYFLTLHKCASSLFADFVLPQVIGLRHIDHAARIYRGDRGPVAFRARGHVYGPLRISEGLVTPDDLRGAAVVALVRDPRDIIVSEYYSYVFTHDRSPDPSIRARQEAQRARLAARTIDQQAVHRAPGLAEDFAALGRALAAAAPVVLRYEDMIEDFPAFADRLSRALPLSPATIAEMQRRSRPRDGEALEHKRSGVVGGHRGHLAPETLERISDALRPVLDAYGYR